MFLKDLKSNDLIPYVKEQKIHTTLVMKKIITSQH